MTDGYYNYTPETNSGMSDSVKLRFEHGIWCLVFSYLSLIAVVVFCFLVELVSADFTILAFLSFIVFVVFIVFTILNFSDAIDISKKEKN